MVAQPRLDGAPDTETHALISETTYRAVSLRRVLGCSRCRERAWIVGGWLGLTLACVGLGLASVVFEWSGLPLRFGGVEIYITVYPPLLICLLLTLALGWWWGAIPAYLATLSLALYAGMSLPWAALFACADPLYFAVMAIGYRAIPAARDLRDPGAVMFFLQLSFVASIFSSSGALIWWYTNGIDRTALLPIWQGWWLGAFVQSVVVVGPLMALLWPRLSRWLAARPELLAAPARDGRRAVLHLLGAITAGVLAYGFVTLGLAGGQLAQAALDASEAVGQAATVMRQTTWVFFWVFALIILFIAFFGYRLFTHWQQANERLLAEVREANRALDALAHTDALTGLLNRRAIDERMRNEWHRAARTGAAGALVMLDIDHFKRINDAFGHPAGDAVIRRVAEAIRLVMRGMDVAGRYGGEEFVVLLPQTDAHGAWQFAERLREQIEPWPLPVGDGQIRFTVSLGVAVFAPGDQGHEAWLARADRALYQAKQDGRNRTVMAR